MEKERREEWGESVEKGRKEGGRVRVRQRWSERGRERESERLKRQREGKMER